MLPPDFHWRSVASRPDCKDDSVFCDVTHLMRKSERIKVGACFADLNTQRPDRRRWTTRECTNYDQGVVGAELWVVRHQDRLRAEIDLMRATRSAARVRR
jgi:hypothetical protein